MLGSGGIDLLRLPAGPGKAHTAPELNFNLIFELVAAQRASLTDGIANLQKRASFQRFPHQGRVRSDALFPARAQAQVHVVIDDRRTSR